LQLTVENIVAYNVVAYSKTEILHISRPIIAIGKTYGVMYVLNTTAFTRKDIRINRERQADKQTY